MVSVGNLLVRFAIAMVEARGYFLFYFAYFLFFLFCDFSLLSGFLLLRNYFDWCIVVATIAVFFMCPWISVSGCLAFLPDAGTHIM